MKKYQHSFEEDYFKTQYIIVSDFSEKAAKKNDNWFRGIFRKINPYTNILDGKDKVAIEFGCATGVVAKLLFEFGYKVMATDISSYAVKKAKQTYPQIRFLTHDIQKPLKSASKYNVVLALDVIEHLENPQKAIKNMFSIVKSNGIVICSTPNDYAHERRVPTHINVKKPEEWKKIFYKAGFKTVETHQMTFLPFFYRFHWRLALALPIGINFHFPLVCSPVFIFASK